MKRVQITSATFTRGNTPEAPRLLTPGSVVDLDDDAAGQIVIGGRGVYVDPDETKTKDTSKAFHEEADAAAEKAARPDAALAALVSAQVTEQVEARLVALQASGTA